MNGYVTGTYQPETASTSEEAFVWLKKISRTENFYTAKTFINLKRWNTEEKYRETLHKTYRYENQEKVLRIASRFSVVDIPLPAECDESESEFDSKLLNR